MKPLGLMRLRLAYTSMNIGEMVETRSTGTTHQQKNPCRKYKLSSRGERYHVAAETVATAHVGAAARCTIGVVHVRRLQLVARSAKMGSDRTLLRP